METLSVRSILKGCSQPLDFSSPVVLDLCVRNKTTNQHERMEMMEDNNNNNHDNPTILNEFNTSVQDGVPPHMYKSKFDHHIVEHRDFKGTIYNQFATPKNGLNPPLCTSSPCSDTSEISSVSSTASELGDTPKMRQLRPFKAYPRSALPLEGSLGAFQEFRQKFLTPLQESRATNKNMRRSSVRTAGKTIEDPQYLEKRRKNNEAAKRSRDARRMKEDEIAIRAAFLEREVIQLNQKLACREAKIEQLEMLLSHRYTHAKS